MFYLCTNGPFERKQRYEGAAQIKSVQFVAKRKKSSRSEDRMRERVVGNCRREE
jgi:hypothetical protein